jgi:hypothetical protein
MKEEPRVSPQAVVSGDVDRQLTLPEDLIHRGLELARRLQPTHAVTKQAPREFLVRCSQIRFRVVKENADGSKKADILLGDRIDLMVSISPEGMMLSRIAPEQQLEFAPIWNERVYAWLKSLGEGNPPYIRDDDYSVMFYYYENEGRRHLEMVTSEKVRYSGTIIRGDPQHMKSIGILLIEKDMPAVFMLSPIDRQGANDLPALHALVESINQIKNRP